MIRVLAVDDSALMRKLLGEIFAAEGDFEATFARNGLEALALLDQVKPDVVTLDIQMPEMDGLTCLDRIMLTRPCPVVMFSSLTSEGAQETLDALSLGAVDFVLKPTGAVSLKLDAFAAALVDKVRTAAKARLASTHRLAERIRLRTRAGGAKHAPSAAPAKPVPKARSLNAPIGERLVLVGVSTGGPPALDALLEPLPADFPWPIVIAQHMPASFTKALAERLNKLYAVTVLEVARPTPLQAGHAYIGRGDADVIISRRSGGLFAVPAPAAPERHWHPSADRMVESALAVAPAENLVGVLMTGMGDDGATAMTTLRAQGGRTIAEAEETAVVWGMPGELVRAGGAEFIEPVDRIAARLLDIAGLT